MNGEIVSTIMDNMILPSILIIAGVVIYLVKKLMERVVKSIEVKNELTGLEKQVSIRNKLVSIIDENVKSAVAYNMDTRNAMKKDGHSLTEEESAKLRKSTYDFVMNTLPASVKEEGGVLYDIIGGKETLDALIRSITEKYVYEYKTNQILD